MPNKKKLICNRVNAALLTSVSKLIRILLIFRKNGGVFSIRKQNVLFMKPEGIVLIAQLII